MRVCFLLAILTASVFYSYVAFMELGFLSMSGRLGPGFFPRIIGVLLIAVTLMTLVNDMRRAREEGEGSSDHWPVVGIVVGLTGLLVAMFVVLGGTLAMAVFLLVALTVLNRGRHVMNVAVALILPAGIYFLFDVWLNASMPEGLLDLPI